MEKYEDKLKRLLALRKAKELEQVAPQKQEVNDVLRNQAFSELHKTIVSEKDKINDMTDEFKILVTVDHYNNVRVANNLSNDRINLYLNQAENSNLKLNVAYYEGPPAAGLDEPVGRVVEYEIDYFKDELVFWINEGSYTNNTFLTGDILEWFLAKMEDSLK